MYKKGYLVLDQLIQIAVEILLSEPKSGYQITHFFCSEQGSKYRTGFFFIGMVRTGTGEAPGTVSDFSLLMLFPYIKEFVSIIHTFIEKKNK